jgi:hypothetical protein
MASMFVPKAPPVSRWLLWVMVVWTLICLGYYAKAQPVPRAIEAQRAAAATAWLEQHLYLKETHGYNRNPVIDSWARANGNALGSEWCGLTQWACQQALKLPSPKGPAGSYNWFPPASPRTVLYGAKGSFDSVRVGFEIGIFNARRGRIAHITRAVELARPIRKGRPARGAWCIGGNEGTGAKAGMHRTFYPASGIYAASNWLY